MRSYCPFNSRDRSYFRLAASFSRLLYASESRLPDAHSVAQVPTTQIFVAWIVIDLHCTAVCGCCDCARLRSHPLDRDVPQRSSRFIIVSVPLGIRGLNSSGYLASRTFWISSTRRTALMFRPRSSAAAVSCDCCPRRARSQVNRWMLSWVVGTLKFRPCARRGYIKIHLPKSGCALVFALAWKLLCLCSRRSLDLSVLSPTTGSRAPRPAVAAWFARVYPTIRFRTPSHAHLFVAFDVWPHTAHPDPPPGLQGTDVCAVPATATGGRSFLDTSIYVLKYCRITDFSPPERPETA
jgi:hypothetical protein